VPHARTSGPSSTTIRQLAAAGEIEAAPLGLQISVGNDDLPLKTAMVHVVEGNFREQRHQHVTAIFELSDEALKISVADEGPGLDPDKIPDPLAQENLLRSSGRGVFLMRAYMDEVHFRQLHPGTEITLIKHRAPAQPAT
jgi:serine/threonine-protein kinase RsbW